MTAPRHPLPQSLAAALGALLLSASGCGGDDASRDVPPEAEAPVDGIGADDAGGDGGVDVEPDAEGEGGPPDEFGAEDADAPEEISFRPCSPVVGAGGGVTLRGTILAPDGPLPDGEVLFDRTTGLIVCVAEDCSARPEAADGTLVCTEGVVLPGLIDAHDHIAYGILPRWRHEGRLFLNRYDWQATSAYRSFLRPYSELGSRLHCRMTKYGEARMAIAGATSVQGSAGVPACVDPVLLRNLDMTAVHGLAGWEMEEQVYRISGLSDAEVAEIRSGLADGSFDVFVPHIGEGIDETSRAEFDTLREIDLLGAQTSLIHGTGAGVIEFARMAAAGAGLLWSPRSNADLYGLTTNVAVARAFGVGVAIGPDWTPSGSWSVLDEMKCVDDLDAAYFGDSWTDRQIVEAATSAAADVLHLAGFVGRLQEGLLADVAVVRGDRGNPYRAVIDGLPADVLLVLRGGALLYGDAILAVPLATAFCEALDVCGQAKTICVKTSDSAVDYHDETLADVTGTLASALAEARTSDPDYDPADPETTYQYDLAPPFLCTRPAPCRLGREGIPGTPGPGDGDGDGVADGDDRCPAVFDPYQEDFDGDGDGDACDPCPLDPGAATCAPPDPLDIDRDGRPDASDNCPAARNPDQEDADGDTVGDACEIPVLTVYDIQDTTRPLHPREGSLVSVAGVAVSAVFPGNGCWVQEPGGGPYSGILAYVDSAPGVSVGDVVDVSGVYSEYRGTTSEIDDAVVTRRSGGPAPAPEVVAPADVATGGALAEAYEGVLVAVEDVTVTNANPDAPEDYGEFEVTGGLRVDDQLYAITPDPVVGGSFSRLTGVLQFSFDDFKLEPRSAADVER